MGGMIERPVLFKFSFKKVVACSGLHSPLAMLTRDKREDYHMQNINSERGVLVLLHLAFPEWRLKKENSVTVGSYTILSC